MARKYTKLFKMWFLFPLESGRITSLMAFARMDRTFMVLEGGLPTFYLTLGQRPSVTPPASGN